MNWLSKRRSWVLMLASASLFFLPLGVRALWNSDEGRYAEIAREMLELRDWISPHLNYVLYFEKPPLMYWLTVGSFAVFGQTEFAARFWCAVFGLLTVGLTYRFGKHWKDEETGLFAGSILATSVLFFALTQFLVLDMALTFWTTLALYASFRMLVERQPEIVRRNTYLLALAAAGGMLTKGLVGILFPVVCLFLVIAYGRLWNQLNKIPWQGGFIVAALLCAPWFVLITLRHPSFLYYFFVHEHVARFLTPIHHRTAPFYFFIVVLLGGFLPWSVFLPRLFVSAFEHHGVAMKRDPARALLIFWTLFILVFYSVSQSKLVGYLLPVFPALALLCGNAFSEALEAPEVPAWVIRGLITLVLLYVVALCALKIPQVVAHYEGPEGLVIRSQGEALALIIGFGVFLLVGVWGMRDTLSAFGGIMLAQVLLLSAAPSLSMRFDPYLSNKGIAKIISLQAKPEERVAGYGISYENSLQSLAFYAKRRIAVLGDPGELAMGAEDAPEATEWFSGEPTAKEAVGKLSPGTWVVTNEEYLKGLTDAGMADDFEPVGREGQLLLLRKVQ